MFPIFWLPQAIFTAYYQLFCVSLSLASRTQVLNTTLLLFWLLILHMGALKLALNFPLNHLPLISGLSSPSGQFWEDFKGLWGTPFLWSYGSFLDSRLLLSFTNGASQSSGQYCNSQTLVFTESNRDVVKTQNSEPRSSDSTAEGMGWSPGICILIILDDFVLSQRFRGDVSGTTLGEGSRVHLLSIKISLLLSVL